MWVGKVIVEKYQEPITRGNGAKQTLRIAAIVNIPQPVERLADKRIFVGGQLRPRGRECVCAETACGEQQRNSG
jgi:hypothetical protein